jgi:hypothetical protein
MPTYNKTEEIHKENNNSTNFEIEMTERPIK